MNNFNTDTKFIPYEKKSKLVKDLNEDKTESSLLSKLIDALFNSIRQTDINNERQYKMILKDLYKRIVNNMKISFNSSLEILMATRTFGNLLRILANEDGNEDIKYLIRQFELGYHAQALTLKQSGESELLSSALSFLSDNLNPLTIFDVGANKGEFIKEILKLNKPSQIHAFEPQSGLLDNLKLTVNDALIQTNFQQVYIRPYGLSIKKGEFDLFKDEKADALASTVFKVGASFSSIKINSEKIQLERGDEYCINHNIQAIDYLKIDTEGSESDALLGFGSMIENRMIKMIQFEYGVNTAFGASSLQEFYNLLDNKFILFKIMPEGLIMMPRYKLIFEDFCWANFLAVEKDIAHKFIDYLFN